MRMTTLLFTLLAHLPALAASPVTGEQITDLATDFVTARLTDARLLLRGPDLQMPEPPPGLDCMELYNQRQRLINERLNRRVTFWDDPRTRAAIAIGTIWTPAFYTVPYLGLGGHLRTQRSVNHQTEIDASRIASAQLRCFER
ncbi:MAG: hypothetical protein AAF384_03530 [Pseudomonadota bacterium]